MGKSKKRVHNGSQSHQSWFCNGWVGLWLPICLLRWWHSLKARQATLARKHVCSLWNYMKCWEVSILFVVWSLRVEHVFPPVSRYMWKKNERVSKSSWLAGGNILQLKKKFSMTLILPTVSAKVWTASQTNIVTQRYHNNYVTRKSKIFEKKFKWL